ncbi:MAG: Maf family protein [Bacillota bacterium]
MTKIVLASTSPRRKQILEQIGCKFSVLNVDVDEIADSDISARHVATTNAVAKAQAAWAVTADDEVVISADTIVVLDGEIFGKPLDDQDAVNILKRLSGRTHQVITAVAIASRHGIISDVCSTQVEFVQLTNYEIDKYIATGEPFDKAGAYGIQGYGALFVRSVNGCYFNVMGLPIVLTRNLLQRAGVEIF